MPDGVGNGHALADRTPSAHKQSGSSNGGGHTPRYAPLDTKYGHSIRSAERAARLQAGTRSSSTRSKSDRGATPSLVGRQALATALELERRNARGTVEDGQRADAGDIRSAEQTGHIERSRWSLGDRRMAGCQYALSMQVARKSFHASNGAAKCWKHLAELSSEKKVSPPKDVDQNYTM